MAKKGQLDLKFVVDTSKPVKSITELQERIETLRDKIEGAPLGSEEFKRLQGQLQNASSEMKVLEKNMEGLEPQQKAEAFLKMGEGIAGGFAVAQGAMGLMGVESEDLEKIQVKVQSAIAIAQGVRMMSEASLMAATAKRIIVEKAAQLRDKLGVAITYGRAAATTVWSVAQGVLTGAIGASTIALGILKAAIIATGIGALVVAIGALIGMVVNWTSETKVNVDSQKALNAETKKLNSTFQEQLDYKNDLADADTEAEEALVKLLKKQEEEREALEEQNKFLEKNEEQLENIKKETLANQRIIKENSKTIAENSQVLRDRLTVLNDSIRAQKDLIEAEKKADAEQEAAKQRRRDRYKQRKADEEKQTEDLKKLQEELLLLQIEDDQLRIQMANDLAR